MLVLIFKVSIAGNVVIGGEWNSLLFDEFLCFSNLAKHDDIYFL